MNQKTLVGFAKKLQDQVETDGISNNSQNI